MWRFVVAALALGSVACTDLPDIESNVCGNAVLDRESGEDCDTFVEVAGASCRPAGTVGECHFDCRLNADGSRSQCPPGFGCGADGVCREPDDNVYEPPVVLSGEASSWLSSADFDGDGRADLISVDPVDQLDQARFRLHYFDDDAKLVETRMFPRLTTRPVARKPAQAPTIKRATRRDPTDLLFSNYRVGMLPGREDRAWVPAAFSSYTVGGEGMAVVSVHRDFVGWTTPFALVTSLSLGPGIYVPSADTGQITWLTSLPGTNTDLVGSPLAADLFNDADSPCSEVVLAFKHERLLRVFDLCRPGLDEDDAPVDWRRPPIEQTVPVPAPLDAAPLAADMDGDGHVDLIWGSGQRTYVAHGDGHGFAEATVLTADFWDGTREGAQLVKDLEVPPPLALGDISGDGIADFVLPGVVFASRPGALGNVTYFPAAENRAEPWTMAEITDVNGNGLLDVVVAAKGAPGITLLNGTGGPYLIAANLPTHGSVTSLTTGNFDGDQNQDLAFFEEGPPPQKVDALNVTFGVSDGIPAPAEVVAEMKGVWQLGSYPEGGIDALFVTSQASDDEGSVGRFTLFDTNPDRLPFAPYSLVPFSVDMHLEDSAAIALLSGNLLGPESSDALAVGLNEFQWKLWLAPDIDRGEVPPLRLETPVPAGVYPYFPPPPPDLEADGISRALAASGVAADIDGDGRDEALWLMPEGADACALLIYGIEREKATLLQHLRLEGVCPSPELAVGELGGSEHPEIVTLVGDPRLGPRRLQVFWNDAGNFSLENSTWVASPEGHDVRAFSIFPDRWRLAYVTDDAAYQVQTRTDGRVFDDYEQLARFQDARSIAVSDPNGDTLPDIAVGDGRGLWLMKAALK